MFYIVPPLLHQRTALCRGCDGLPSIFCFPSAVNSRAHARMSDHGLHSLRALSGLWYKASVVWGEKSWQDELPLATRHLRPTFFYLDFGANHFRRSHIDFLHTLSLEVWTFFSEGPSGRRLFVSWCVWQCRYNVFCIVTPVS